MNKKPINFIFVGISTIFICCCFFFINGSFFSAPVYGQPVVCASHNVFGFAWSENIGWISFSCEDTMNIGEGNDYGVDIDEVTGEFSGYAWSEVVGWISFESGDVAGCPEDLPCVAEVDFNNGQVSGWAKVLSSDSWIHLRDNTYHVNIDEHNDFRQWAWSNYYGWISFACEDGGNCGVSDYGVETTIVIPGLIPEPEKPSGVGESWDHCSIKGRSITTFHWIYSDPQDDPQAAYEIWVDNDAGFTGPMFNNLVSHAPLIGPNFSYTLDLNHDDDSDWLSSLAWGATYYWKVRVKDNQEHWSVWSDTDSFTMQAHAWPWTDFASSPGSAGIDEIISFMQDGVSPYEGFDSVCYGGGEDLCQNKAVRFEWDFGNSTICDSNLNLNCRGNTTSTYSSLGSYSVELKITDDIGICSYIKDLDIGLPYPKWKEIKPR